MFYVEAKIMICEIGRCYDLLNNYQNARKMCSKYECFDLWWAERTNCADGNWQNDISPGFS